MKMGFRTTAQDPLRLRPQKRRGVTLLEVLIALSLAALLLVALSGILSSLVRKNKIVAKTDQREWLHEMDRVLWNDLAQARSVALNQGVLWLSGGPASGESANGGSQTIAYELKYDRIRPRLVRSVIASRSRTGAPILSQTMLWDVSQIRFERVDDSGNNQPLPREPGPTPRAFRYTLWIGENQPPIESQILVR